MVMKRQRREKNMKKVLSCALALSLLTAGTAFANGYRIPEQSLDATSKAGANIASASSADAAYYNPAAVSFLPNNWMVEVDGTYLHLTAEKYRDNRDPSGSLDGKSKVEDYGLPTLFVVSPEWNNMRFGFSITTPYGLGKRWDQPFPRIFANKFELRMTDFNPTLTYAITNKLSVAGGVRLLYASASLMTGGGLQHEDIPPPYNQMLGVNGVDVVAGRALDGDAYGWGFNLALDYKANKNWNFAATYRSKVDLNFKGDASMMAQVLADGQPANAFLLNFLNLSQVPGALDTKGRVTVIAPAVAAFSTAYSWDQFTLELTFDRTFWSSYNQLNFNYDQAAPGGGMLDAYFGPVEKNWKDANAVRLGLEYNVIKPLTLMAGICYEQGGAPESTLGFELPDADAWVFSVGARYAVTDRLDFGVGVLYDMMNSRQVDQGTAPTDLNGEFSDGAALLVTAGIQYRF
jgi:long-chain fatty acid transport protein